MVKAHRPSTCYQFQLHWKKFQEYVRVKDIKLITKRVILAFLSHLFYVRQLSPKTVLVYRNALSLPLEHAFNIFTKDVEFGLLSRSFFLERPPVRHILPSWSLRKVLEFLKTPRFQDRSISLKDSLLKTLFLVALATGNRVSELSALRREGLAFSRDYSRVTCPVSPNFFFKNERLSRSPPNITFSALGPSSDPHPLCPVTSLRRYLRLSRTKGDNLAVFINPISRCNLKAPSLSQYLCSLINLAQPGKFPKGHDVRKMASSLAWARGIPLSTIVERAFWSSSNVFIKRYLTPLPSNPGQCVALNSID